MLTQDEELWSKELTPAVEQLISTTRDPLADRADREAAISSEKLNHKYCF